jgi:hypoxanthine-guanine phosphoribosyltransferase
VTGLPREYRDLTGTRVVLIDDLIDGGGTTEFARKHLLSYGALSVDIVVLVKKRKPGGAEDVDALVGFMAPDGWLTGIGMDDSRIAPEANRWAEWIAIANE